MIEFCCLEILYCSCLYVNNTLIHHDLSLEFQHIFPCKILTFSSLKYNAKSFVTYSHFLLSPYYVVSNTKRSYCEINSTVHCHENFHVKIDVP